MTIILGKVCDNTCVGFQIVDNTPDLFGFFGPAFADLSGPATLVINQTGYDLTVNNHTLSFGFNDPIFHIEFNPPEFPGAEFKFTAASGPPNLFANLIAAPETDFFCPVPGVPEPGTWVLMLLGFMSVAFVRKFKWA